MSNDAASFIGSIPQHYDQGLGPIIFVDYAADIARRVASGGSTFWPRPYGPAKNSSTISQNFCGACSNIGCVAPGIIAVLESEIWRVPIPLEGQGGVARTG